MKKAVALGYDKNKDKAPKVLAKGKEAVAKKIIERAKELGIEIREDKDLVEVLEKLNIYDEIPPNLYEAIAKILIVIYEKKKSLCDIIEPKKER
jgi:flagellar biosynthesis protein